MTADERGLVEKWREKVRRAQMAHYARANRCDHQNLLLGVPVIVLSAVAGATVFAAPPDTLRWLTVVVGCLSILGAILAGLQTFLKLSERAEKHRLAAARYGDLKREAEALLASPPPDVAAALDKFRIRWDKSNQESPMAFSKKFEKESL